MGGSSEEDLCYIFKNCLYLLWNKCSETSLQDGIGIRSLEIVQKFVSRIVICRLILGEMTGLSFLKKQAEIRSETAFAG